MSKRLLLITGPPGIGKTTVLMHAVGALKEMGYEVGGMVSKEVREGGVRVGFEVMDLHSGRKGWLARACQLAGPRIGKYCVDLGGLESIGARAVSFAADNCDLVAVDEIGPMELLSAGFRQAVEKAIESGKPFVATIHFRSSDPLVESIRKRDDAETFVVTTENRVSMPGVVVQTVLNLNRA